MEFTKLSVTNASELAKDLAEGGGISYRAQLADNKMFWNAHVRRGSGELCRLIKVHGLSVTKEFKSVDGICKFHRIYFPDTAVLHHPLGVGVWSDYHYLDGSHLPFEQD